LIGGLGAAVAAILLIFTLKETRKQTKLGFRGFLGVELVPEKPINFIREPSDDKNLQWLKVWYKFSETNRVPLLLKARDWKFSEDAIISIQEWYKKLLSERGNDILTPVIVNREFYFQKVVLEATRQFWRKFREGTVGIHQFFIHGIFGYQDYTRKCYWVYARWIMVLSTIKKLNGKSDLKIRWEPQEYRLLNQN